MKSGVGTATIMCLDSLCVSEFTEAHPHRRTRFVKVIVMLIVREAQMQFNLTVSALLAFLKTLLAINLT